MASKKALDSNVPKEETTAVRIGNTIRRTMKPIFSGADTRAEYKRILGHLEFHSGTAFLKFVLCFAAASALAFLPPYPGLEEAGRWTLGIIAFCGLLWMTEAIPAFAVALLGIGLQIMILGAPGGMLFPDGTGGEWERFVEPWASPSMWLFFGGFILAKAAARTGLDREIAVHLFRAAGSRPDRVLLTAMGTTFVFSMFLSNTATAAMMIAILGPMLANSDSTRASRALIIGVAFSANIGGMGTIIGTPPNAIASGLLDGVHSVDFLRWMLFGLPPAFLLLVGLSIPLARQVRSADFSMPVSSQGREHHWTPGDHEEEFPPRWQRWTVLAVFAVTISLWLSGGWHSIPTAVVSFVPIVILSITGVIRGTEVRSLDWDILILLAGGLSLGVGVSESGLAEWLAGRIDSFAIPNWMMAMLFCFLTLLLSNFMSNTAAANILIPIGIATGLSSGGSTEAAAFAIPMALSASTAMCLPISTPPNAIAYASGRLHARDFLLPGLAVGLAAVPLTAVWSRLLLQWMGS